MKVIFVINSLTGGGAERVVTLLSKKFVSKGIDTTIITDTLEKSSYQSDNAVKLAPFFSTIKQKRSKVRIIYQAVSVRKILKGNPDAIVIGVMPIMFLVVFLASAFLPNIIIASDHTSFERPLKWHMNFIRNYLYRIADAVTVLTQVDYDYIGSRLKNKWVMPNPLAFDCIKDEIYTRNKNILAIGRLDVWYVKGFDLLLEACSKVLKKHSDWYLEIAGTGSEESVQALKTKAFSLGIGHLVLFSGFHIDIDKVMRNSSLFVLSSRHEGFGLVLIEAMSQGCACISFDCGGRQKEIIQDGIDGVIIENCDVIKLAEEIEKLIEDTDRRRYLSQNGILKSKVFNLDHISEKWIAMLHQLKKNKG